MTAVLKAVRLAAKGSRLEILTDSGHLIPSSIWPKPEYLLRSGVTRNWTLLRLVFARRFKSPLSRASAICYFSLSGRRFSAGEIVKSEPTSGGRRRSIVFSEGS
jgi:hypothetical protein